MPRGIACSFCRHCRILRYWRAISSRRPREFLPLLLHQFVGEDGIGDLDDVARGDRVAGHLLAHDDDFLDHQRRARERFQYGALAALDAPRDLDFAFAREQRNRAHLAQVHADGIVDLLAQAGGQFEVEQLFGFFELLLEILGLFEDFDARDVQAGKHVLELGAARQISGQNFADFVVQDVALFLAHLYEPLKPVVFVFKRH